MESGAVNPKNAFAPLPERRKSQQERIFRREALDSGANALPPTGSGERVQQDHGLQKLYRIGVSARKREHADPHDSTPPPLSA